jgi:hypothetical protein
MLIGARPPDLFIAAIERGSFDADGFARSRRGAEDFDDLFLD